MARKNGIRRNGPLAAFDEWVRPWKDDEFDAEKAAKLIYDLHTDKEALFTQIDESDTKLKTITDERDDLEDEVDTLKAVKPEKGAAASDDDKIANAVKAALEAAGIGKQKTRKEQRAEAEAAKAKDSDGDDLRAERLEIALEKNLTKAQALRLVGKTREELESDADAYIEEHSLPGAGEGGPGGQAPPSQRPQTKARTNLVRRTEVDVDPDGDLDPGALAKKYLAQA